MIDVNGGAVEPSSRHLTGGPREISPQVKCTLAGSKVEMCEEKIESRDGGSDVCEVPGFRVIPRRVAVGQCKDRVLQGAFRVGQIVELVVDAAKSRIVLGSPDALALLGDCRLLVEVAEVQHSVATGVDGPTPLAEQRPFCVVTL